jgi:hypothetical protein
MEIFPIRSSMKMGILSDIQTERTSAISAEVADTHLKLFLIMAIGSSPRKLRTRVLSLRGNKNFSARILLFRRNKIRSRSAMIGFQTFGQGLKFGRCGAAAAS